MGGRSREEEGGEPGTKNLRGAWQQLMGWGPSLWSVFRRHSWGLQVELKGGTAWTPSQEADCQQQLTSQIEDSSAENTAHLPGPRVRGLVTWEKQELSNKGQHPTNKLEPLAIIIIQCIPEACFIQMQWTGGGERKSLEKTHEEQYLGISCIWYLGRVPRLQPWIPFSFLNVLLTSGFDITRKICAVTRLIVPWLKSSRWTWNRLGIGLVKLSFYFLPVPLYWNLAIPIIELLI